MSGALLRADSSASLPAVAGPRLPVPALVAAQGDAAAWRYVEFFAANIRNPNTRSSG